MQIYNISICFVNLYLVVYIEEFERRNQVMNYFMLMIEMYVIINLFQFFVGVYKCFYKVYVY